ncbi:MAG: DNA cytosine methyltransferase [Candidatus Omnitrophota bacterium]
MNVLSLFDGISCGHIALDRAGIKVDKYYASEIKPHAIKVTQHNYPDTIQLGNVLTVKYCDGVLSSENGSWEVKIDMVIGGSPCQDLSQGNKKRLGLEGNKSSMFWEYVRILNEVNPTYFLLENVEMPLKDARIITQELKVNPININSSLVSAQSRNRWYWTNIPGDQTDLFGNKYISEPANKGIKLQDILTDGYTDMVKSHCLLTSSGSKEENQESMWHRYTTTGMSNVVFLSDDFNYRKGLRCFNHQEIEQLQTLPAGYTKTLDFKKALDVIGDGWTVDVIAHIFSYLKADIERTPIK